jgi:transcriptional regulator with XRE-family HTH domain
MEEVMDVPSVIRQRLADLGVEQRQLATAAQVTESYISQLLTRKKLPPAPNRTDIYDKLEPFLGLPRGELSKLADLQRKEALQRQLGDPLTPLFQEVRALILRKCAPDNETHIRMIFEKQAFGELERLVTQKLLEVVKGIAKEELGNEAWLRQVAQLSNHGYEQMRVLVLEFLDTDIFNLSVEHAIIFFDPLIDSWDIDLATFGMTIVLNRRLALVPVKKFAFVEWEDEEEDEEPLEQEPGLAEFLQDTSLGGNATEEEIAFLRRMRFKERRPTPLYYYRALQNLRDPLHFHTPVGERI